MVNLVVLPTKFANFFLHLIQSHMCLDLFNLNLFSAICQKIYIATSAGCSLKLEQRDRDFAMDKFCSHWFDRQFQNNCNCFIERRKGQKDMPN